MSITDIAAYVIAGACDLAMVLSWVVYQSSPSDYTTMGGLCDPEWCAVRNAAARRTRTTSCVVGIGAAIVFTWIGVAMGWGGWAE